MRLLIPLLCCALLPPVRAQEVLLPTTAGWDDAILLTPDKAQAEREFPIDAAKSAEISVGLSSSTMTAVLVDPAGVEHACGQPDPVVNPSVSLTGTGRGASCRFMLPAPAVGVWKVRVKEPSTFTGFRAASISLRSTSDLVATLIGAQWDFIAGQQGILQLVVSTSGGPLAPASVNLKAFSMASGQLAKELQFADDGLNQDAKAGDGIFTAAATFPAAGDHRLAVEISGTRDGAAFIRSASGVVRVRQRCGTLTRDVRSKAVDLDSDGLPNLLEITVPVKAVADGRFRATVQLQGQGGVQAAAEAGLTAVSAEIVVPFELARLRPLGSGPWQIASVTLECLSGDESFRSDRLTALGPTVDLDLTTALRTRLALNGNNADRALDLNGNGLFETLELEAGIDVPRSGSYEWTASLFSSGGKEVAELSGDAYLMAGRASVLMPVTGRTLLAGAVDGPFFLRSLVLSGTSGSATFAEVLRTQPYLLTQFENGAEVIPTLAVSPVSLDFGAVETGKSKSLTLSVKNDAATPLIVLAGGFDNAAYSLTSPALPATITAGATSSFAVSFTPAAAGAQSGYLRLSSNSPRTPTVAVALSGSGTGASLSVTPTALDFGPVTVGQTKSLTLSLSNNGTGDLRISALTVDNPRFAVVSPAAPFTLAAGARQTVTVRFSPVDKGSLAGVMVISSNDPNRGSASVPLAGTGTPASTGGTPKIQVSPSALDFGTVRADATADKSVVVSNTGTGALNVTTITASNSAFSVVTPLPFTVAPDAQQSLTIRFTPGAAGAFAAILTINSNDAAAVVALAGTAESSGPVSTAVIDVTPKSLAFGPVLTTTRKDLTLSVSGAQGASALVVTALSVDNPRFTIVGATTPLTISFGGLAPITVRFTPTASGAQTGSLTIRSNASNKPVFTVPLTASGVVPGDFTVANDDDSFETSVGVETPGVNVLYLQRLTPPAWPATLKAVRIYIPGGDGGIALNGAIGIFSAAVPGALNSLRDVNLRGGAGSVNAQGRWVDFPVTPLTIESGDFLVGFGIDGAAGRKPARLDTNTAPGRAWVSTDAQTLRTLPSVFQVDGNFAIRAVVTVGAK